MLHTSKAVNTERCTFYISGSPLHVFLDRTLLTAYQTNCCTDIAYGILHCVSRIVHYIDLNIDQIPLKVE
jgi:hypothetical protein